MVTSAFPSGEINLRLELRGGLEEFWYARDKEILVEGPRGTGKTRVILELLNALCHTFPGLQVLIVRKYAVTLASTCLKTFNEQVMHNGDGVSYFGGAPDEPSSYRYNNGSRITLGGLDNPKSEEKLKSGEYDIVYVNEATDLNEENWTALRATLRHVVRVAGSDVGMPLIANQRLIGDCNPAYRSHWLNQRCEAGRTRRIKTRIIDNPLMAHKDGTLTEFGQTYVDGLPYTGPKRDSWVLGLWTGTENACYPTFDRGQQIRPLEPGLQLTTIIAEDYGAVHLCTVAALSIDQYNRRWLREVWAGADERPDPDKPSSMDLVVAQFKYKYKTSRGRVDPNQAKLALAHGFNVAKGGSGGALGAPRMHRIDMMEQLMYVYEGGRVPTSQQVARLTIPRGPFAEPDSYGFYMVEGNPGIEETADEIEGYHYVYTETPKGRSKDVYRVDENRIASLEYANEEWEEGIVLDTSPPTSWALNYKRTGNMPKSVGGGI